MFLRSFCRVARDAAVRALVLSSLLVLLAAGGCLDRPVVPVEPTVTARVQDQVKQNKVTKIDLLFMIDNSSSMADKQQILALAVGDLVSRLVSPACIDPNTGLVVGEPAPDGTCATGERDFDPVNDIHIGIISSSLGSHGATLANGADICPVPDTTPGRANSHDNDMAHLLTRTLPNGQNGTEGAVPTAQGFLDWTGGTAAMADQTITMPFADMVAGVGQHGCGYEAQLESVYRFLNDPDPWQSIDVDRNTNPPVGVAVLNGTDQILLQQRRDFLRPDSLVAVISISDENDCSIDDTNPQGFYSLLPPVNSTQGLVSQIKRGTSVCDTNPNDLCCFNCGVLQTPAGCTPAAEDPACQANGGLLPRTSDWENIRCANQKSRYGADFLFPVDRYVEGFTQTQIHDRRNGNALVANPLYSDLGCIGGKDASNETCVPAGARDPSLVFFAGIVGVPWQDIAVDAGDISKGYKTAQQLSDDNVWSTIVGDPAPPNHAPPIPPSDSHMIESRDIRPGLAGPDTPPPGDPIHGHEYGPPVGDLQYACVFDLPTPVACDPSNLDCDCSDSNDDWGGTLAQMKSPLCWNKATNAYTDTQVRAKGYPGLRQLEVLQGIGDQAIVASICPVNVSSDPTAQTRPDFGYRPAISALISRLRTALRGRCLPRTLQVAADGSVPCVIVEAFNPPPGQACVCEDPSPTAPYRGRRNITDPSQITPDIAAAGSCRCELVQLSGAALTACATQDPVPPSVGDGWCYVDPAQQEGDISGACQIVAACPDTDKRLIRFAQPVSSEPRPGATAFITCEEKSFPASGSASTGLSNPCAHD